MTTISGASSAASSTAASPESASARNLSPEARSRRRRSTERKIAWSSTASTRGNAGVNIKSSSVVIRT